MRIAIIGTGRMARNLGMGWARAGHTIVYGSRDPDARAEVATTTPGATVTTQAAALQDADVVVLTLPYLATEPFAKAHAHHLRNRLVIDISNPFDNLPDNRLAGAEITARAIGPDARVIAAFKDTFWSTLLEPVDPRYGLAREVHFAGDDEEGKRVVAQLVADLGFRSMDCGPLKNARVLDGMVSLLIELDMRYNKGEHSSSWRFLSDPHTPGKV